VEGPVRAEMEADHRQQLLDVFAEHLRSHGLVPAQVRFLAGRIVRAAISSET
jgi:hypothetical protein